MRIKKRSAFTLIELLVVIAIIGILSTLAVVALQSARSKARDSKRVADVKQMQTALELYFNDNGSYPTSVTSTIATSGIVYMASMPTAPTPADGSCTDAINSYVYTSDGSTYSINFCLGGQTSNLTAGYKALTRDGISSQALPFVCGDVLTDSRDSQQYPTVQIGTQCWMAKNLNYDSGCASATWSNGADTGWCGCYSNSAGNCTTYGKIYQWSAAMVGSDVSGVQGVCPSGWHIPTSADYTTLNNTLSVSPYSCGYGSAVKALSSKSNWTSDSNDCTPGNDLLANNASGFNALPSGMRYYSDGVFMNLGSSAYFWTSTKYGVDQAYYRNIWFNDTGFNSGTNSRRMVHSVRCIKN